MRRSELREMAGVSGCVSQSQSGTARGTARRDYARLPGARLTEKRSFESPSRKARPASDKNRSAKRCETIRVSRLSRDTADKDVASRGASRPSINRGGIRLRAFLSSLPGLTEFVIAGLVPAISIPETRSMRDYFLYILASRPGGAIYVGVTRDLARRLAEHRQGTVDSFTKRYGVHRLVYFETYPTAYTAIQREKNIKHWPRSWKANLIKSMNPAWNDLSKDMF
jgi:putative endonuclease